MKKEVLRRCIVTGESHPKQALIRVVRTPDGVVIIDHSKKANGRVCRCRLHNRSHVCGGQ